MIISIQSLILVPQPYFNEPGYEREMNTPKGDSSTKAYNQHIRESTIRFAMLEMIRKCAHPPPTIHHARPPALLPSGVCKVTRQGFLSSCDPPVSVLLRDACDACLCILSMAHPPFLLSLVPAGPL